MSFASVRQFELSDGTTVPVGNYHIATYSTTAAATYHTFVVMSSNKRSAVLELRFVGIDSGSFVYVDIPIYNTMPTGTYRVRSSSGDLNVTSISYTSSTEQTASGMTGAYYYVALDGVATLHAQMQLSDAVIRDSTSSEIGADDLVQTFTNDLLVEGLDYGTATPAAGNPGRIFFVKVDE